MKHLRTPGTVRTLGYALRPDTCPALREPALAIVREAIERHAGNLSAVARDFGVARHVVGNWCRNAPALVELANKHKATAGLRRDNWAGA